jgi:hypothetical protein
VVLPKTPPGSSFSIDGTIITITAPLGAASGTTTRSAALTLADGIFIGRNTNDAQVVVYDLQDNATFSFQRDLAGTSGLTEVSLTQGSARINNGGQDSEMALNDPVEVSNDAVEISLAAAGNYVALPVQSSLQEADLELDFADTHSVWVYNNTATKWEAYSADADTASRLTAANLSVPSEGIEVGDGMFVYSETAQTLNLADDKDLSIADVLGGLGTLPTGWHLLAVGNQNDTAGELGMLPGVETVWVKSSSGWSVYASDADLVEQINQPNDDLTLLAGNEALNSTSAIWVYVKSASSTRSTRLAPPPSY